MISVHHGLEIRVSSKIEEAETLAFGPGSIYMLEFLILETKKRRLRRASFWNIKLAEAPPSFSCLRVGGSVNERLLKYYCCAVYGFFCVGPISV